MGNRFVILLFGLIVGGIIAGYLFSSIVGYLVISLIVSTILKPAVNLLSNLELFGLRMPRWLAVTATMLGIFGSIIYSISIGAPLLIELINNLSKADVTSLMAKVEQPIAQIEILINQNGIFKVEHGKIRKYILEFISFDINPSDVTNYIKLAINVTSSIFVGVLAVSFITFFFLLERGLFKRTFLKFVPNAFFELTITTFYKIESLLTSYLLGLATQITAFFIISLIGYNILGLENTISIALFAAFMNLIPYIGPLIGNLTAVFVGLITTPNITDNMYAGFGLQIFLLGLLVQFIDNVALEPMIFSRNMKSHPVEIFIAIFAGSALGGVAGMVAAIPIYTIIRVSISEIGSGYRAYRVFKVRNRLSSLIAS